MMTTKKDMQDNLRSLICDINKYIEVLDSKIMSDYSIKDINAKIIYLDDIIKTETALYYTNQIYEKIQECVCNSNKFTAPEERNDIERLTFGVIQTLLSHGLISLNYK